MKVINFDLPSENETFLHRIGRTGRAGYSGDAIHFCDATEKRYLIDIEEYLSFNFQINTDHPYHSDQIKDLKLQVFQNIMISIIKDTSISINRINGNISNTNEKLHKKNIINSKKNSFKLNKCSV